MTSLDYLVLIAYFLIMAGIGFWAMQRVKKQEDYFMGGRGFGKLFQTFAAFGAGTGSADPINTARTTYTSGLSGMWSVMYWLFVTPIYWITGLWYRRMRHLTLGDWFVERYESRGLGVAYAVFGLLFYIVYTAMLFTAVGKFAGPMIGVESVTWGRTLDSTGLPVPRIVIPIETLLVCIIALVVMVYGVLGGITAAYWTDLIQGTCIVVLSILLIPFGLSALVETFGDPATMGWMDGFRIMHEQLPAEQFQVIGSGAASEFPLYRIAAIVLINLVGIVVLPHFIVTGGGSAKSETSARVGLVTGNLLKRFCTIGWALTALIALALYADSDKLATDPDLVWGEASKQLLGPGLRGLMLACLLAALMSSADCYMLVCSALVVRNVYKNCINPNASEKTCLRLGRFSGLVIIAGAVMVSLSMNDVYEQLKLTWIVGVAFAAPFWIGHWWRRATTTAAWITVSFCACYFFLIPFLAPSVAPGLRTHPALLKTTDVHMVETTRQAAHTDIRLRETQIAKWDASPNPAGERPKALALGDPITQSRKIGGTAIYWGSIEESPEIPGIKPARREAKGNFKIDYLLYDLFGVDLTKKSDAMLDTYQLVPKVVLPFLVMIGASLLTRRNSKAALDRYYVKMRTPVDPDPEIDAREVAMSCANPNRFAEKRLFPGTDLEIQRPTKLDVFGFFGTLAACFGIVWLVLLVAGIGA